MSNEEKTVVVDMTSHFYRVFVLADQRYQQIFKFQSKQSDVLKIQSQSNLMVFQSMTVFHCIYTSVVYSSLLYLNMIIEYDQQHHRKPTS